jgi:hypothetical protein
MGHCAIDENFDRFAEDGENLCGAQNFPFRNAAVQIRNQGSIITNPEAALYATCVS